MVVARNEDEQQIDEIMGNDPIMVIMVGMMSSGE